LTSWFFVGDRSDALSAFGANTVTAVLIAGLLAPRHHCASIRVGHL